MDKDTWEEILSERAAAVADARVARLRDIDPRLKTPKYADAKQNDPETYFGEVLKFLKKEYPFEKVSDAEFGELTEAKDSDIAKWIYERGPSPKNIKSTMEAQKFLPLLNGVAKEGDDWYSMGQDRLKAAAVDMGYKVSTPEQFKAFLDQLGEYQQKFDRGQLLEEMRADPLYIVNSLLSPSATREAENIVATGEGDEADVAKLALVDFLTNAGIVAAPSLNIAKAPMLVNAGLGAGLQAGAEAARQGATAELSGTGQEFDFGPVATAGALGASIPAMLSVARAGSQFPGQAARDFSRGVMRSARSTNPVVAERETLKNTLRKFNDSDYLKVLTGESENISKKFTPKDYEELKNLQGIQETIENVFGVKMGKNGFDVEKVLKAYDKPVKVDATITKEGVKLNPREYVTLGDDTAEILLDENTMPLYRKQAGAKYDDLLGLSKAGKMGEWVGRIFQDVGGRFEPMTKIGLTPSQIKQSLKNDYKDSDWYDKLDNENRKIIDKAFEQKELQREFERISKKKPEAVRSVMSYMGQVGIPADKKLDGKEQEVVEKYMEMTLSKELQ